MRRLVLEVDGPRVCSVTQCGEGAAQVFASLVLIRATQNLPLNTHQQKELNIPIRAFIICLHITIKCQKRKKEADF